ncbi:hypothetical protein [Asticcacaulis excentricus]|uniref:hypothetical protein n=1 Tax=Asticcacaulis excentricus TaxID=78587 RepID=UPI0018D4F905|nr:hypothetical protein [Asticcacaulis excentricus]
MTPVQEPAQTRPVARPAPAASARTCQECGTPFRSLRAEAVFCSPECNTAFNNRHKERGATLYQLMMALRFERSLAKKLGLWTHICALCAAYRQEDIAKRAGRHSWRHPEHVLARLTHIFSRKIG